MKTVVLIDPAMGPDSVRIVPVLGITVRKGDAVEVPDDVAGTAPTKGDLGSGLLAQSDVWSKQGRDGSE